MRSIARVLLVSMLTLLLATPAVAQEEAVPRTTISAIDRGQAAAVFYLEGAALYQADEDAYVFSDGTGSIVIGIEESAGQGELPLFELIGIEGALAAGTSDEIDVSRWAVLPIMTPAVIVEEPQVIDAFWNWIVAYGSQAPTPVE
jgi:uncharacterized protein YdeI (BOF family)